MSSAARLRFFDIGANLTDPVFRGVYRGKQKHPSDFAQILQRARDAGVERMMVTGTNLADSKEAVEMAKQNEGITCTVGCHPTRCKEFLDDPEAYYKSLQALIEENRSVVVAVGETGLDYDRLQFCPKDVQATYFKRQIDLAEATQLPMFLHLRNAHDDFLHIMEPNRHRIVGGVVHSYDGPLDVALRLIEMGFYIGLNGCSLRKEENLDVVKHLPTDKLMLETDCPWCEVRPSHAGFQYVKTKVQAKKADKWEDGKYVKSRNEPALITQVLEIVSGCKGEDPEVVAEHAFTNAQRMFGGGGGGGDK
ncbi:hypothetical protein PTSG_12148 [Salpingoeca rosetta]|uniref:Uncharacterized protein n=1 Tax=Salpingoeca rosetta (strain ATCC 50818 / BSB-021) TaxID=946362 RepID=F2U738_SALR5|nr:uncharacterized protein PTSG_12148 [Salpingoeca rosetta]EGD83670.1 hypothetical protein PTSG_12148 [Salpingoeca rosetta]|eukprot:XP_004995174.1 hypothetical protein PTSG_12148 [Salpingoeca rosetta]